jgi:hypothetical protein
MTYARRFAWTLALILLMSGIVAYLHDPPWLAGVTAGMRAWQEGPPGTRFRWTAGRASFFVPSDAVSMTLPLRAGYPGDGGTAVWVDVSVDNVWVTRMLLPDPDAWARQVVPLAARPTSRRHRRVDLRVSRVVHPWNYGVQVGVIELEGAAR